MLNDSTDAENLLNKVKNQLNDLFNSNDTTIYDQYLEMFKEEPQGQLKKWLQTIGVPVIKLKEIWTLMNCITTKMKAILDQLDPW